MNQPARRSVLLPQEFGLILVASYFVFIGGNRAALPWLSLRLTSQILAGGIFLVWLGWKLWRRESWPRTSLDLPILGFLWAALLSTLFSVDRRISLEGLLLFVSYALLYFFLVDQLRRTWSSLLYVRVALIVGVVVILLGLLEFVGWYFGVLAPLGSTQGWFELGGLSHPIPPSFPRLGAALYNPNIMAAFVAMTSPLALGIAISGRSRRARRDSAIWFAASLVVIILTFSRGGLLSFAVGILPVAMFAVWEAPFTRQLLAILSSISGSSQSKIKTLLPIASTVAVVLLIALVAVLVMYRLEGRQGSDEFRLRMWGQALSLFTERPLFGQGLATFPLVDLQRFGAGDIVGHPHNLYLNVAADGGIALLVALVLLGLFLFRVMQKGLPALPSRRDRYLVVGAAAGLLGLALQSLADSFLSFPNVMIGAIGLGAIVVVALEQKGNETTPRERKALSVLPVLIALLLTVPSLVWMDASESTFKASAASAAVGDWPSAVSELEKAIAMDPEMGVYRSELALAYGHLYFQMKSRTDLAEAIALYEAAVVKDSGYSLNHANLAVLYAEGGQPDKALSAMSRAIALDPHNATFHLNRGRYAEAAGQESSALQEYRSVLEQDQNLLRSPFWRETPLRQQAKRDFLSEMAGAVSSASQRGVYLYLTGDLDKALVNLREAAKQNSNSQSVYNYLGLALAESGQPEEALDAFNRAVELNTRGVDALTNRAGLEIALGNLSQAERDLKMATFSGPSLLTHYYWGELARARGNDEEAMSEYTRAVPSPSRTLTYEAVVYQRFGIIDNVLPGLVEIEDPGVATRPLLRLAGLYEAKGDQSKAILYYREALEHAASLDSARQRLRDLEKAEGSKGAGE